MTPSEKRKEAIDTLRHEIAGLEADRDWQVNTTGFWSDKGHVKLNARKIKLANLLKEQTHIEAILAMAGLPLYARIDTNSTRPSSRIYEVEAFDKEKEAVLVRMPNPVGKIVGQIIDAKRITIMQPTGLAIR